MTGKVHIHCHDPGEEVLKGMRLACPACPFLGVNITAREIVETPDELSHTLHQKLTADGNFQLNRFKKKQRDREDISLWGGVMVIFHPKRCFLST